MLELTESAKQVYKQMKLSRNPPSVTKASVSTLDLQPRLVRGPDSCPSSPKSTTVTLPTVGGDLAVVESALHSDNKSHVIIDREQQQEDWAGTESIDNSHNDKCNGLCGGHITLKQFQPACKTEEDIPNHSVGGLLRVGSERRCHGPVAMQLDSPVVGNCNAVLATNCQSANEDDANVLPVGDQSTARHNDLEGHQSAASDERLLVVEYRLETTTMNCFPKCLSLNGVQPCRPEAVNCLRGSGSSVGSAGSWTLSDQELVSDSVC